MKADIEFHPDYVSLKIEVTVPITKGEIPHHTMVSEFADKEMDRIDMELSTFLAFYCFGAGDHQRSHQSTPTKVPVRV